MSVNLSPRQLLQGNLATGVSSALRRHALDVVAEGIEREQDIGVLINLGCRYGQGYFFSPPVSAAAAEPLLWRGRLPVWAENAMPYPG